MPGRVIRSLSATWDALRGRTPHQPDHEPTLGRLLHGREQRRTESQAPAFGSPLGGIPKAPEAGAAPEQEAGRPRATPPRQPAGSAAPSAGADEAREPGDVFSRLRSAKRRALEEPGRAGGPSGVRTAEARRIAAESPHSWRYLHPADLKRLRNMEFVARKVVEGYFSGKHRSPYRDFAQEFADYRGYVPGDDLRALDWKAHARTDRYYIKLFRKDTGMLCYILLDKSNSMAYRGDANDLSKLEYACYLAAALGFLTIKQGDRAGFCLFDDRLRSYRAPGSTLHHLFGILNDLEWATPGNTTRVSEALRHAFHIMKRRGLLLVISDFLDEPNDIFSALSMFTHRKFEVILFHILHDHELGLPRLDHARFVDLETRASLVTEPEVIRRLYQEELGRYLSVMRAHAGARRIDYNLVTTSTHYNDLIEKYLWVRQAAPWMK